MNRSLRRRLWAWLSVAIVSISVIAAAVTFGINYDDANELQDAQLSQVASALARQPIEAANTPFRPRDGEDAETHFVIRVLGSTDVAGDPEIDVELPADLPQGLQSISSHDVRWRVMVARDARGQAFGIAQRQTVRDEVARDSAMLTLLPTLVLVPLLVIIINLLLRQGFAPMVALSREVDAGEGAPLTSLDTTGMPSEILPLVHAVNGLLARLGTVLEQQRRMVADAAHELRTPVAVAQIQADNLAHARMTGEASERLRELQSGLGRIATLVDQLLRFARVQGASPAASQAIALDTIVRRVIEETLPMAQTHQVDLGCLRLNAAAIQGSEVQTHALVRNAVDNAVRYTPAGGQVDVSLEVVGGVAQLIVEDTGPGIQPEFRSRVFEPFFRILGSQQSGNGLGLAIVRSAAQAQGGSVVLESRPDGRNGLRFVYRQKIA